MSLTYILSLALRLCAPVLLISIGGMFEHGTVGNSRTVELACQILRSFVVTVADANSLRTLVQQMLCSELTHMTGTYHQNLGLKF